jgi:hypothetical protein
MRPVITAIFQRLLQHQPNELSLDVIGEAIGIVAITAEEIDELFHSLENAGRQIGSATPNIRQNLNLVLREARQLRNTQNATPDTASIALASGLTPGEVRAALLYASVLGQGK